ncbi:hypothetical protein E2C01_038097 [Portunus trituberculatus]|uniref:Uncharacterized protein n=1 Tax=Portunus trituberculatus TaxID=210409 RepID=A0A5B7FJ03_PORTR|nr:hypothetical protein [Portunus trituberculatus]
MTWNNEDVPHAVQGFVRSYLTQLACHQHLKYAARIKVEVFKIIDRSNITRTNLNTAVQLGRNFPTRERGKRESGRLTRL